MDKGIYVDLDTKNTTVLLTGGFRIKVSFVLEDKEVRDEVTDVSSHTNGRVEKDVWTLQKMENTI